MVRKEITAPRLHFAPTLIFEMLSPSTERKDRTEKFELYQAQKVKYYVIVNPNNNIVELYLIENVAYKKQNNSSTFIFDLENCQINFNFDLIW